MFTIDEEYHQEREVIESKLTQCIQLNTDYREAYQKIKNKKVPMDVLDVSLLHFPKVVKKAKEFSFSEKYIFGRFDSFCMRLRCEIPNMMESSIFCRNLLKMFSTINQFTSLFNSRTEVCDRKIADEIQFCRNRFCKFSAVPIGCSKAFGSFIPK